VEEFGSAALGDARRVARLVRMAAGFSDRPAGTVTEAFSSTAERRAVYRFLENEDVDVDEVAEAAYDATIGRCANDALVYVPVDGSSLNITDDARVRGTGPVGARGIGARGFQVMTAIGVSPDGTPLGLLGQSWWSRSEVASGQSRRTRGVDEKETRYWLDVLDGVRARFHGETCRPWFQLDRGGDAWPVLLAALRPDIFITVRAAHDRRVAQQRGDEAPPYLWDTLDRLRALGTFTLEVAGGPGRKARKATMEVRATLVTLDTQDKKTEKRHAIPIFAVQASEVGTTPAGERPLEWMLLTNHPATTLAEARLVIQGYAFRWKIEEFHKIWKSGACNVEDTQLQSEHGIRLVAFVLGSVAMRLFRIIWLSRTKPTEPATTEFSNYEIDAVYALKQARRPRRHVPTMSALTLWIAELGGYTGKSSGGPPGVIVLTRGLAQVVAVARALRGIKERRSKAGDHEM
jgi:hypothetical protein